MAKRGKLVGPPPEGDSADQVAVVAAAETTALAVVEAGEVAIAEAPAVLRKLTKKEGDELDKIEIEIQKEVDGGNKAFMWTLKHIGDHLKEIKEKRLYECYEGGFEGYCLGRWGFSLSKANRWIAGSESIGLLITGKPKQLPAKETGLRALNKLPKEQRTEGMNLAVEIAKERGVAVPEVKDIIAAVRRLMGPAEPLAPPILDEWAWVSIIESNRGGYHFRLVKSPVIGGGYEFAIFINGTYSTTRASEAAAVERCQQFLDRGEGLVEAEGAPVSLNGATVLIDEAATLNDEQLAVMARQGRTDNVISVDDVSNDPFAQDGDESLSNTASQDEQDWKDAPDTDPNPETDEVEEVEGVPDEEGEFAHAY